MPRFGFVGPSYASESPNVDCQRCINWYPERVESPTAKTPIALYPTPGLKPFATLVSDAGCDVSSIEITNELSDNSSVAYYKTSRGGWFDEYFNELGNCAIILWTHSSPYIVGDLIRPVDLGGAEAGSLNGHTFVISAIGTDEDGRVVVYIVIPGRPSNYEWDALGGGPSPSTDKVTVKIKIGTSEDNLFGNGTDVTLSELTDAEFLNGVGLTIVDSSDPRLPIAQYSELTTFHEIYGPVTQTGKMTSGAPTGIPVARAEYSVNNNRLFAISGINLFEIDEYGIPTPRGVVENDNLPASMSASATQLMIASGGKLYCLTLVDNTFTGVPNYSGGGAIPDVSRVEYCDGYFVALLANSQQCIVSDPLDGTLWDAAVTFKVSVFPDDVVTMIYDHQQLWLGGKKRSVAYYDSGSENIFDCNTSSICDQGVAAANSVVRLDNSVLWIGSDERGQGIAWRAQGYVPARISNHAVEQEWASYSKIDDAVAYGFTLNGHAFWHIYFPTANKSWRYDCATQMWHEVQHSDRGAHRSQCHAFCFGKHIVGDWATGNLYELTLDAKDDFGNRITSTRRSPHLSAEQAWQFFSQMQVDAETGTGADDDPNQDVITLRWSDDSGRTWSNGLSLSLNTTDYKKRLVWRRLGRSRDRVFEISTSSKRRPKIVDAYLNN